MNIIANDFVKRQTSESRFSHFAGGWSGVIRSVMQNWNDRKPGYRDGVVLVRVPADGFFSSLVELQDGDELVGGFEPRKKGEEPRKFVGVQSREKRPAAQVDIVLYSSDTLAKSDDNWLPVGEDNWEIISVNASPVEGEMPINTHALMHNHFGSDGGTETNLSDSEFVALLRDSFEFWKNKAMCV